MQNRGRRTGRRNSGCYSGCRTYHGYECRSADRMFRYKIVVTTGLASNELFRIGSETCKLSEALVYLCNEKNQYENVYGIEMWDHNVGDIEPWKNI